MRYNTALARFRDNPDQSTTVIRLGMIFLETIPYTTMLTLNTCLMSVSKCREILPIQNTLTYNTLSLSLHILRPVAKWK